MKEASPWLCPVCRSLCRLHSSAQGYEVSIASSSFARTDGMPNCQDLCVGHPLAVKPHRGGVGPSCPSLVPAPLWPGHQLQPVRLPAQSPDPPRKLDGAGAAGLVGAGAAP